MMNYAAGASNDHGGHQWERRDVGESQDEIMEDSPWRPVTELRPRKTQHRLHTTFNTSYNTLRLETDRATVAHNYKH